MRKLVACLGAATLVLLFATHANAQATLKPYVTLILDTSGSMQDATGTGPPSCGGKDTKLNHAKCAIDNIANSYGDIEFGLARFRNITSGTTTAATFPTGCCANGPGGQSNGCANGEACTTNDDMIEMLNPLIDDIGTGTAKWVNDTGNTCSAVGTDPEVWNANSSTPLAGALKGIKRYWQGLQATASTLAAGTGGASETGTTATFTTTAAHNLVAGEPIVIAGVAVAGYNGNFLVASAPSATTFTVTGLTAGLAKSGGGSVAVVIFQGSAAQGFSPIVNDPINQIFVPSGCDPTPTCTTHSPAQPGDCCTSQCRPYITILLTDGQETCGPDDPNEQGGTTDDNTFPPNAAAALLITQVGADNYRIETKPIGFGVAPPALTACTTVGQTGCQIEDIAHSGGSPDIAGKLEGFYASDEAGLELAISQIIEGSVRHELCNGLDDDCDGKIDEDFPTKGNACNNGLQGVCLVAGKLVCRADGAGLVCNAGTAPCTGDADGTSCSVANSAGATESGTCQSGACVPTPGVEICNGLDDDCDGKIDEGLTNCGCVPSPEICDGKDNDCDGKIDEDTSVPCGINLGVCTTGVEVCQCTGSGSNESCGLSACSGKEPCGGATPCVETCNGKDDDCDGVADGLSQACSNLPANGHPAGDPANNPGDPGQGTPCDAEGTICACHPGTQVCPANGSGVFSACAGEALPTTDVCNGIDDDCDGKVDEGFVPAKCGECGSTTCVNGQIVCAEGSGSAEICNGLDDDCDGKVDEDVPTDGSCSTASVCAGTLTCINGSYQCEGTPIVQESCNCLDDDCDGKIDEDNGNCPTGSTCNNTGITCECDLPCGSTEFPCPSGKICDTTKNLCITDPCAGVTCSPDGSGNATVCQGGTCVNACSIANCGGGEICVAATGQCELNNCTTFPAMCTAQQSCVAGVCVTNPCAGVVCPTNQYCESGSCVASCADVPCTATQRCRLGVCQPDPCNGTCIEGTVCNDASGTCVTNPCLEMSCPTGQYCDPNDATCETDPCVGTTCPGSGQVCFGGTCNAPGSAAGDAGMEIHVTAAGGGCSTDGDGGGGLGVGLALGLAMLLQRRRAAGGAA